MAERRKLDPENAPLAFKIANEVYNKRMSNAEGRRWLATHAGFNINSAGDLIADFRYLMLGESFERTIGNFYATYFLQHIYELYGLDRLQNALRAFGSHIEYYEGHFKTTRHGLRAVRAHFEALLVSSGEDDIEQDIVEQEVKKENLTKEDLKSRIRDLEDSDGAVIEIKGLALKRKNWIIALIKELRGHSCQICSTLIRKKAGGYYIEAAHITPKAKGGGETLDNILILCPNHHKEFDWGDLEIVERSAESIILKLNGKVHQISL